MSSPLQQPETPRRPLLIVGNGVHLSGAESECRALVRHLGAPVVSSWAAADIIPTDEPLYIGRFGLFGDRASNFAVQNADFILSIGCRLSIPQIGHRTEQFAPNARLVMVDVDRHEIDKPTLKPWLKVCEDAGEFIRHALTVPPDWSIDQWVLRCQRWKENYPMTIEDRSGAGVNSFHFIEALSAVLDESAVVVTDMGTAFTCTFQAAKIKLGQRWFTASGHAPMGYGLPAAIGAAVASGRKVVCITGDGGLQLNIQELATLVGRHLPVTCFVLNNGGYLTMKHTQKNHFGRLVGADEASGLHMPKLEAIAAAYGLSYASIIDFVSPEDIRGALSLPAPSIIEVFMDPMQPLIPRVQTEKDENGNLRGGLLEDMYPYLPREEFNEQMRHG